MQLSAGNCRSKFLSLTPNLALSLFCVGFGGGAIWIALDYPYGTLTSMGPGFVPTAVAAILVFLGVLIGLGFAKDDGDNADKAADASTEKSEPEARGIERLLGTGRVMLFILGAIVLFGSIVRSLGLAISVFVLVMLVSYARQRVRLMPTLVFATAVTIAACVLFVTLLGLETPVLPRF